MSDNLPARGAGAEAVRQQANASRVELLRAQQNLAAQQAEARASLETQRKALEAEFSRQTAALEAQLKPLQAQLAQLQEVLHATDLYLGRAEDMVVLRDGAPSDPSNPITVRQRVLAADEESLALVDQGGVDARSMNAFLDWIAASMENTARLLPEERCVVAVVPTRQQRDTGDPWMNMQLDQANKQTHWLFRNGERLWVMTTDFIAGSTILPRLNEFVDMFYDRGVFGRGEPKPLEPGSEAWMEADRMAGARRRHYMKVGLILQGIIDRTTVFHPLPDGGVNLLDVDAQEQGKVRMVNELDMALDDGREGFRAWQARLNSQLAVGMRIVGDFGHGSEFGHEYVQGDRWTRGYHRRLHPGNAEYPKTGVPYPIEGRNKRGEFVIRYARTEKIEKRNVPVPDEPGYIYPVAWVEPRQRASCVVRPDDDWIVPFDLASVEDLTYYLNHREARKGYQRMVPILRAALTAKQAERDAEAPFRLLLAGMIADRHGLDADEVARTLPDVVDRWKLGNKHHRALTGDAQHEAKAIAGVMAEYAATLNARSSDRHRDAVLDAARAWAGDRLLAVLTKRDGTHLAVAAPERSDLLPFKAGWVDTRVLSRTGQPGTVKTWTTIPARTLTAATIWWETPGWATWKHADPVTDLTGPELDAAAIMAVEHARGILLDTQRVLAVTYSATAEYSSTPSPRLRVLVWDGARLHYLSWQWKRTRDGLSWTAAGGGRRLHDGGARFSSTVTVDGRTSVGDVPWIDPTDTYARDLWRPRLVWVDVDVYHAWQDAAQADHDAAKERRKAVDAEYEVRSAWLNTAHYPALEAHLRRKAHVAFVAEYGPDAEDLFDNHFQTLSRKLDPARRTVNNLLNGKGWSEVAGKTVADVSTTPVSDLIADYRYPNVTPPPRRPDRLGTILCVGD